MRTFARSACALILLISTWPVLAEDASVFARVQDGVKDIWKNGDNEIYLPFKTYHLRSAYDREKINRYQENPLGLGFGRSIYKDNVLRGLYVMGFQDSHFKPSYMAGYVHEWVWEPTPDWRVGGGLTAFLMMRTDIGHYTPFPGILPTASIGYKNFSVETTFVPGSHGAGNIFFFWGRIELDR